MDLLKYQSQRNKELSDFKKDYADLKVQYTSLLQAAIYEKDPQQQQSLVDQLLQVNSELSGHIRDFLQKAQGQQDQKTIVELTQDILNYQKEYSSIKDSTKKADTIQKILGENQSKLDVLMREFNIFLGLLALGIFIVIFLILRTPTGWQLPQPTLPPPSIASL